MALVLASSSPRRQELLRAARIPFTVRPANIPEERRQGEAPEDYSARLAFEKADAVRRTLSPEDFVLGADTIVVVDHHVLEKPLDTNDAKRMLRIMSGRAHQVITSICLLGPGVHDVQSETTEVHIVPMAESEMDAYIASGEPMDKAGGYGIQGMFSRWVLRVDGDYPNVVGLPVSLVYRVLHKHRAIPGLL